MAGEQHGDGGRPGCATEESHQHLDTHNNKFQLQPIAGEDFRLLPKGMSTPRHDKSAVYRAELVQEVLDGLNEICQEPNRPGVYVQGPEGIGKSFLLYTVAQIAKFKLKWITVYVPNCIYWAQLTDVEAMGFFLDRVVDAFSVDHLRQKFPSFYKVLRNPPGGSSWIADAARGFYRKLRGQPQEKRDAVDDWYKAAKIDATKVAAVYREARRFLKQKHENFPVLLIFDEVNALWPENHDSVIYTEPWNLASFGAPELRHGALLVSGTTDCEFISESEFISEAIPNGVGETIVRVGPLDARELGALLSTEDFEPLRDLRNIDEELWQTVVDASGNVPRELKRFLSVTKAAKRQRPAGNDEADLPPQKKLRLVVEKQRAANRAEHKSKLDKALNRSTTNNVFRNRLSDACRSVFIYGAPAELDWTTLRVPNWVISAIGMHPTTSDAQTVYFEWFQQNGTDRDKEETALLSTISSTNNTGGERDNALERLLTSKLTRMQNFELKYRLLRNNRANGFCTDVMGIALDVQHRLFKYAADPPDNFQIYPDDTLCTHLDQHGGERRVDLIHYRKDRVVYIEVTVSNYGDAKIPSTEGDDREVAILASMQKWLGANTFEVSLETVPSADQGLQTSQKKLVANYKQKRSRNARPEPPALYYIVATTCPITVKLAPSRTNKFNWIGVSFLEDLIASDEIIPARLKDSILKAQAKDAGRPS